MAMDNKGLSCRCGKIMTSVHSRFAKEIKFADAKAPVPQHSVGSRGVEHEVG